MKKINFFLALYFSLQVVGCGIFDIGGGSSPTTPLTANCELKLYDESGSGDIILTGRSNCEVDGDVLSIRNVQTGQIGIRLNKTSGTFINEFPPEPATYQGQVTTSNGDKNWTFFTSKGIKALEVIIDGGSSTNDGSSPTTPLIATVDGGFIVLQELLGAVEDIIVK